jgi:hypothetical protein
MGLGTVFASLIDDAEDEENRLNEEVNGKKKEAKGLTEVGNQVYLEREDAETYQKRQIFLNEDLCSSATGDVRVYVLKGTRRAWDIHPPSPENPGPDRVSPHVNDALHTHLFFSVCRVLCFLLPCPFLLDFIITASTDVQQWHRNTQQTPSKLGTRLERRSSSRC